MKKSYPDNGLRGKIASALLVLSVFAGMASCMEVDNTLGNEYIPQDHYMKMRRDSTFQVKTYNVTSDSVVASGLSFNLLGGYKNETTGVSLNGGVVFQMQVATSFHQKGDSLYGSNPVIDSAFMQFYVYNAMGKTDVEQVFDLYELNERIFVDSTYYYDFDPAPYMPAEPLATFAHSGDEAIRVWLDDETFFRRLADTTGYTQDSLFKKRFKSFYLKPRVDHADAAMYRINFSSYSWMTTYYHNDEYPDTALATGYNFAPYLKEDPYNTPYNQIINVVDRDYSGLFPEIRLDDDSSPNSRIFVESFGGIMSKLEFTKESIEELKAKVKEAGYRDVAVNKALLQIAYPTRDPDGRDQLPGRLGVYFDFKTREGIPDYDWYSEYTALYNGYDTKLTYDGFIKPSRYLYEMDVTYYVQRLMREDFDQLEVYLAPSYETPIFGSGDNWSNMYTAELAGYGSETPILLVLTYTMIR